MLDCTAEQLQHAAGLIVKLSISPPPGAKTIVHAGPSDVIRESGAEVGGRGGGRQRLGRSVSAAIENAGALRTYLFGVSAASRHIEYLARTIGHGFVALVHDEDAIEHQPADGVVVGVALILWPGIDGFKTLST